jgi:biopolymer transport protein ExbD
MKLEMTLPERPGFLHAVPVLNLFALMQLFFLLGPSLLMQSGVTVDLPPSRFQMDRYQESLVVTLGPGEPLPHIHLGRDPVTRGELLRRLEDLGSTGAQNRVIVLLQSDAGVPVGTERELTEMILSKGFRVAMVGKTPSAPSIPSPPP